MIFDVLFGDIFSFLNEIILKICEDLLIGLSQLSEKLGGYWSQFSDENAAKDVTLSCNTMSDNWICFKFFGHLPCKSINKLTNFCCNQSSVGYPISICVTNLVLAEISAKKPSYSRHAQLTVDGALPTLTTTLTRARNNRIRF